MSNDVNITQLTTTGGSPIGDDRNSLSAGVGDFTRAGELFRLMTPEQQERLFEYIAAAMVGLPEEIVQGQLLNFYEADPRYAEGVARALGRMHRLRFRLTKGDLVAAPAWR